MRHLRQRATGEEQNDERWTLPLSESQNLVQRAVSVPHVLAPLDDVQARSASQSRRVARAGSASYWSPAEVAVSGASVQPDADTRPFELVRSWDGLITSVTSDTLTVRIVPVDGAGAEEEAEFLISDIPVEDRPLVQPGAPLFWFVGYETGRGRRRRTSELKMRRVNMSAEPSETWLNDIESIICSQRDSVPTEG